MARPSRPVRRGSDPAALPGRSAALARERRIAELKRRVRPGVKVPLIGAVRRLKDVSPRVVLARKIIRSARLRFLISKVTNPIPSPHRFIRKGLLTTVSASYRARAALAKECKRKQTMRRRMTFKHGGAGHGHRPHLKLRVRGC